jgi:GNAT superfamily N-acetyltransferase
MTNPRFKIKIETDDDGSFCVNLLNRNTNSDIKYFGFIVVDKHGFVNDSWVDPSIRGHGYGKKIYKKALSLKGFLRTDLKQASPAAQKLWQSLQKEYHYETNKEVNVTIYYEH